MQEIILADMNSFLFSIVLHVIQQIIQINILIFVTTTLWLTCLLALLVFKCHLINFLVKLCQIFPSKLSVNFLQVVLSMPKVLKNRNTNTVSLSTLTTSYPTVLYMIDPLTIRINYFELLAKWESISYVMNANS